MLNNVISCYIIVNSLNLYAYFYIQKERGVFQHSSFLAGGATIAAGRFTAENGVIKVLLRNTVVQQLYCLPKDFTFLVNAYVVNLLFRIASVPQKISNFIRIILFWCFLIGFIMLIWFSADLLWFQSIWAYSGHYKPTAENLSNFMNFLEENGVDLKEIEVH